jgi:phospholipid/cholesterol/gamma-HCH transport system substrate-binding protein
MGLSELKVGIFLLAGLGIIGFLILNATGDFNPFKKRLTLRARFLSADGLREGGEVQLAGIHIGRVDAVNLLPPDSAENARVEAVISVMTSIDGKPVAERIRSDSTAQLIATSALGNEKMINITPGTAKGSPVVENHVLDSSAAISINQLTSTGNDLLQQINKLAIPTNEILTKANQGQGTLGRVINDESLYNNLDSSVAEAKLTMLKLQNTLDQIRNGKGTAGRIINDPELYNNLNNAIDNIAQISKDLRAGNGTAGKFLSDDAVYEQSKAAIEDLRQSIKSAKPAIDRLNEISKDLGEIAKNLNEGKGSAGKLLKDEQLYDDTRSAISRLNTTAERFNAILGDAQAGKGTLGKILTDESLYNNFNQTSANISQFSAEGTKFMYDFRQNPKKFLTIKFKLF